MNRRLVRLSLLAAASVVAACGSSGGHTPTSSAPTPRPPLAVSFRWTNPASELTSPDATFVRAFIESWQTMAYSGDAGDAYPGFGAAEHDVGLDTTPSEVPATYKSVFLNILRIENSGGESTRATVCLWMGRAGFKGIPIHLLYFHKGATPPADQAGPAKRPAANVFGGWYATNMEQDSSADREACINAKPADLPSQDTVVDPFPGWPDSK